jgi:hypothetical protein
MNVLLLGIPSSAGMAARNPVSFFYRDAVARFQRIRGASACL